MIFKNRDKKLKKHVSFSEKDTFWDISDITPPKKTSAKVHTSYSEKTTLVVTQSEEKTVKSERIPKREEETSTLLKSYAPKSSLITDVSVYSWHSKYTFYERFCLDAHKFFNVVEDSAEYTKYFSYMPSYMQMSSRQRKWYFYWRSCVRKGEYLPNDSSYILLFVYEIINLPDLVPAHEGLHLLCEIWRHYRENYTKLDKYLGEFVCDYCLINGLSLPLDEIRSFLPEVYDVCALSQFYIPYEDGQDAYTSLLFSRLNTYKWWKSKYINDENRAVFEKHIRKGFANAIKIISLSDGRFDGNQEGRLTVKKTVRDSFSGALCAYNVKRRIEVSYVDLGNISGGISFIVTDLVRCCENRVRAHLGIRARLTLQNLTEEHKRAVDAYFDEYLPSVIYEKRRKNAYEYDIVPEEVHEFSVDFDNARKIEEMSWQTTDKLTEEMYDELECEKEGTKTDIPVENENVSIESETLDIAKLALGYIANGDHVSFEKLAEDNYMMSETLAECVNELCFEILSDVGIEEKDGKYELISDYEQEIREWLKL